MPNVYIEKADTLHFNSSKDQSFKVTTEEKFRNNFGAFTAVLTLKSLTTRIHYMDAYDIVISLSKKEQEVFQEIKNFSDRDLRIAAMDHWENLDKSVQGTLYQRLIGSPVTHGCVRMLDDDLEAVYKSLPIGSKVFIY